MKTVKIRDVENALKIVIDCCERQGGLWMDESFAEFVSLSSNLQLLKLLSAKNLVNIMYSDGQPYALSLTEEGSTYFYNKKRKRIEFLKDFFSRFITGFVSGVLVSVVGGLLLQKLT